jgi:flagellar biosynthesis/type III secretory pathway protein FliH
MIVENLQKSVDELELSVRARECLNSACIETIGELVQKTEKDLLMIRNFGKTSLREIQRKLADIGLSIGMSEVMIHQALCKNYRPATGEDELAASEAAGANDLGVKANEGQTKTREELFMEGFQRGYEKGYEKGYESKLRKG